jgi:ribosome biogenesis protein MAK21
MANRKEQRTAQLALEALKDLLINNLLPDRKMIAFKDQPLMHPKMDMRQARLLWYEGLLKASVERIMNALELGLKSTVEYFKKQCLETVRVCVYICFYMVVLCA